MPLRIQVNPQDPRVLDIYSGDALVGGVAHERGLDSTVGPYLWFTCFASEQNFASSETLIDAAEAVARQWRAWLDQATLRETPDDAGAQTAATMSDDDLRKALGAVHRALTFQRTEIDRLRALVQMNGDQAAHRLASVA